MKKILLPILFLVSIFGLKAQNNALNFNGSGATQAISVPGLAINQPSFTVEFWVKPTANATISKGTPFCFNNVGGATGKLFIQLDDGTRTAPNVRFSIQYYGSGGLSTSETLPRNVWSHVAISANPVNNSMNLYINGILNATNTSLTYQPDYSAGAQIKMGEQVPGGEQFEGAIDELRVWQGMRTAQEIFDNYAISINNTISGLLVNATFNETPSAQFTNQATGLKYNINTAAFSQGFTAGPRVGVKGNNTFIVPNSIPIISNNSNFGATSLGSPISRAFSIQNIGTTTLGVSSVIVSGVNASDFILSGFSASNLTVGGLSNFNIQFNPSSGGVKNAIVSVISTDAETPNFVFSISGIVPIESALHFDGSDDQVNLGSNFSVSGTKMFSSQFWFKSTVTSTQKMIFSNFNGVGVEAYFQDGAIGFAIIGINPDVLYTKTSKIYNDNIWHHAAISYNGNSSISGVNIYVDGDLQNLITALSEQITNFTTNSQNFTLGSRPNGNNRYQGQLDNLSFWNTTLTQAQIRSNIQTVTLTGAEPGLLAYYNFNQSVNPSGDNSSYTTLANQTTLAGANGTLSGFALNGSISNWVNSTGLTILVPTISGVSGNQSACENNNSAKIFSVSAVGSALNYQWYENNVAVGTNRNQYSVTGLSLGSPGTYIYECVVSNWLGSATSAGITFTVNANPTVTSNVTPSTTVCRGQTLFFNGEGASTYEWSDGITNNTAFAPTISGIYTVNGTSTGGCLGSGVVSITVLELPTVTGSVSPTPVCAGQTATFTGSGAVTYIWNDGTTTFANNTTTTNVVFTPTITGTYYLQGSDGNNCTSISTVNVVMNALPIITFKSSNTTDFVCLGQPAKLSAESPSISVFTISGGVAISNGINFSILTTTTYTVSGIDNKGCVGSTTKTVTVLSIPTVTGSILPSNSVCFGTEVTFAGVGASTFTYTGGVMDKMPFLATVSGIYTLSGSNASCGSAFEVLTITVLELPTVTGTVSPTQICAGQNVTFSGFGAFTYGWQAEASPFMNTTATSFLYVPTVSGTYNLQGKGSNNCTANASSMSITVNQLPNITFKSNTKDLICQGQQARLQADGASTFTFTGGTISQDTPFIISNTTTYTVSGINNLGCVGSTIKTVTVLGVPTLTGISGSATYGTNYNQIVGSSLLSYTLAGVLPDGLSLNNGSISGFPTVIGFSDFTITGSNGACSATKDYSITVNKADLIATIRDINVFQLAPFPTNTFNGTSFLGLKLNDSFNMSYKTAISNTNTLGSFDINGTISGTNLSKYNITVVSGKLNIINPEVITVIGVNVSREYGNPDPEFTGTILGINPSFPNITISYYTNTNELSNFGKYPIFASITGIDASRYALVSNTVGSLTIRTRRLIVRTFDYTIAEGQPFPETFPTTIIGLLAGSAPLITFETQLVPGETKRYNIIPEIAGVDLNFYSLVLFPGILYVRPAITIIGNNLSKTYGQPNPIATGTLLGVLPEAPYVYVNFVPQAYLSSTIGGYDILPVISGSDAAKYGYVTILGMLEITKANLTIAAANSSRSNADTSPFVFQPVFTGLVNNDQIHVDLFTDAPDLSTLGENYNIYPISISGERLNNYNISTLSGVLKILNTVPPIIPITVTAGTFTRKYGELEQNYGGTIEGTISNTDNVIISYSTNANTQSSIGNYALFPVISGTDLYKYSFTTVAGQLNILANTLTVTALNYTREYGVANPPFFNTQVSGLLNADVVSVSSTVVQNQLSPVGLYPILPIINSPISANYEVITVVGELSITKAKLTVIGGNFTRMYNQPNPILGYNMIGYKNGDRIGVIDVLPLGKTDATFTTPVSSEPSTVTYSGATDNNYDFVYLNGQINIIKSTQTITGFRNFAKIGINNPITISGFASSGLELETINSTPSVATLNGLEINGVSDGLTTITFKQMGDNNYLAANPNKIVILATSTGIVATSVLGIMGPEVVFQGVPATYIMPLKVGYTYDWGYIPLSTTGRNITWINPSDSLKNSVTVLFSGRTPVGTITCKMYDEFGNLVKSDNLSLILNLNNEAAAIAELAQTLTPLECPPVITDCKTNFISVFNYGKKVSSKTACSKGGFGDFTATGKIDTLIMGNAYNFTMGATTGGGASSLIFFAIWLDYNNNGSYEDLDDFLRASSEPSTSLELKNLVIRNNEKYEGPRRIRISMKTTVIKKDESCTQEGIVGETEDYMVYIKKPQALEAPSFISPNDDGKNDFFIIKGINPKVPNKLTIMDRLGVEKYKTENYQNNFNGIISDVKLQDGTYYYYFNHGEDLLKGFVEIRRK